MELERRILDFWKEKKIFEKTLEERKDGKPFVFYDGPPFATGLPHYGHILAGTIKDAIPRYQTMRGRYVRREWGWDCHGLPLENIVEQELGLKHKKDIEAFGIAKFNEAAKKAVLRYEADWKEVVPRTGRFVDMERPYKTMDSSYTESVWWSFKTLYDRKLIYEGYKIMLVCPRCETSLAQSEVALGGYHDLSDIAVTVKFELKDEPKTYLLAWTTTPWTLPGNTALAVNPEVEYVEVRLAGDPATALAGLPTLQKGEKYILAKALLEKVIKVPYEAVREWKGKELVGKSYVPLFDYYAEDTGLKNYTNGWKVYPGEFVTTESGTGLVHTAPAFGEDDYNLCQQFQLPFVQHVGMDGAIRKEVADFAGLYVKQKGDNRSTDKKIAQFLQSAGKLFAIEWEFTHPYPQCWRCDTPLLNYATSSWFVKVSEFKEKLVRENQKVTWVPSHMRDGRFGKWLEGAKDWAISRSRFWGAPLPVWRCKECKEISVISSLEELKRQNPPKNRYFAMRHGEAMSNVRGVIDSYGDPSNHLTEKGREQAAIAASKLKDKKITKIFTSPLIRAQETAEIVAKELGLSKEAIVTDKRFIEFDHGNEFQGKSAQSKDTDASEQEKMHAHIDGSESLAEVRRRILEGLADIEKKCSNEGVLIVTHGSPMWMLITGAAHMDEEQTFAYRTKREDGVHYFIRNTEPEAFDFWLFPHNEEWELDLHRPYIEEVKLPCACGGEMEIVKEVFDCWFESGSMPYGQFHFPFENKEAFRKNFPADFIAEGLDQTRGWFYSMMVLGVGLFGETPYRHVIVNGIILGEDGQKMSKRLKNYPDVMEVIEKYGADALRHYLLSSPVMRGEDVAFSEKSVIEVSRKVIGRLLNVHTFYATYAKDLKGDESWRESTNSLDRWILARLGELRDEITEGMERYELDSATRGIDKFVDDLSTWYLRRSRERFKGDDAEDKEWALSTTRAVLLVFSKLIAPFMPFVAEELYQKVKLARGKESVHLESWPEAWEVNTALIEKMGNTRRLVELALAQRAGKGIKVRQPLAVVEVSKDEGEFFEELVMDEVNVKHVAIGAYEKGVMTLDTNITPELRKEGRFRELTRTVQDLRKKEGLTPEDKATLIVSGNDEAAAFVREFEAELKKATLLSEVRFERLEGEGVKIDEFEFILKIQK